MAAGGATDAGSQASERATCGTTPADDDAVALARITWARGTENGRDVWTCAACSRTHLRSIEGKLDSSWW